MSTGGCELHPGEKEVGQCGTCRKPICIVCTKLYGYFCSAACKAKAKASAPANSRDAEMAAFGSRLMRLVRLFMLTVFPLATLIVGGTIIWKVTSKEGKIVWTFKPDKDLPFIRVVGTGNNVVAACEGVGLYGLDRDSGQKIWVFSGERGIAEKAPVLAGRLVIVSDYKNLYGVDANEGKQVWQHAFPEGQQPDLLVGEKYVAYLYQTLRELTPEERLKITGPIRSNQVPGASVLCVIRLEDGNELWKKPLKKAFFAGGELAVGRETIYYGTHTSEEELEEKENPPTGPSSDPKTPAKPEPKGDTQNPAEDEIPLAVQEITTKFTITAFDANSERGKWKAILEGGSGYSVSMQATSTGVLVTTSSNLYSLSEADGKVLWKYPIKKIGFLFWEPQVKGNLIFVPGNNTLHCLNLKTGREQWTYVSDDENDPSEPEVEGETVFLTTYIQEERKTGTTSGGIPTYRGTEELAKEFQNELPTRKTTTVGELLALDAATGTPKWRMRDVGSKLILGNGLLIALRYHTFSNATETRVTAIKADTGEKRWESSYQGNIPHGWTDARLFFMVGNSGIEHFTMSSRQPPRENEVGAFSIGR